MPIMTKSTVISSESRNRTALIVRYIVNAVAAPPALNSNTIFIFFRTGILKAQVNGIGTMRIMMSVKMDRDRLEKNTFLWLRQ